MVRPALATYTQEIIMDFNLEPIPAKVYFQAHGKFHPVLFTKYAGNAYSRQVSLPLTTDDRL